MSATAPTGRRVALVLVLVVVGAGVVGAIGPVAAQTDGGSGNGNANGNGTDTGGQDVTVNTTRDGGTVVVSVSEGAFDSTAEDASIDVSFTDYSRNKTIDEAQNTSGFYEFEVGVTDLVGDADVTEPRPTVNVSYPNGTQTKRIDVRLVRLATLESSSVDVTAKGVYTFPVDQEVGHDNGSEVPLQVSNPETSASKTVNATLVCSDDCLSGEVTFDPGQFQKSVSPLGKRNYTVYPNLTGAAGAKQFDLRTVGSSSFTVIDRRLGIRHPLIFDGSQYNVSVKIGEGGQNSTEETAVVRNGLGVVGIPNFTKGQGLDVDVSHSETEGVVVKDVSPNATTFAPDATAVPYENETRTFNLSVVGPDIPGSVETVWLAHNASDGGEVRRVGNASVMSGSLLAGIDISEPGEYRLLIAGEDTVVGVNASVSAAEIRPPPDDGGLLPEGLWTVVLHGSALTLLGLAAVVVSGWTGELARTTTLGEAALLVGLGAFLAAFGVLWVLGAGSYGIHAFAALILVGVGWMAGTRQTFNDGTTESILLNVIVASIGLFAGLVVALVALTAGPTLVDYATAAGGVVGASIGFLLTAGFTPKHRVTIELVDEETREVVGTDEYINVTRADGTDRREVKASGGKTALTLPEGGWKFSSGSDAIDSVVSEDIRRERTIRLPIARPGARIRLRGMTAEDRVSDATVTIEPADGPGDETELPESRNEPGLYGGDLPPDVSKARVTVSHDDYQPVEQTYRIVDNRLGEEIDLAPKLGSMEIRVALHGDPIPDVPVEIEARTDLAKEPHRHEETNDRGRVVLSGVAIGEYDVGIDLPTTSDEFEIEPVDNPVTVREDQTTTERIDVRFTYELPPDSRRQVREIRDRLESIASHPRSDVAIPTFYASVVHELLDTVEDVPERGRTFLEAGRSPAATVEALLAAAEGGAGAIDEAMSSKQNVDLFAACGDMEPVDAEWSGWLDLEKLFALADEDAGKRRARLAERLDEVDETISAELRDLSEVRPAQDMWEQTRDLARETPDEAIDAAAVGLLAAGLLDAIDALFDRDPLRERMTRTVF